MPLWVYRLASNFVHSGSSRFAPVKFGKLAFILTGVLLMGDLLSCRLNVRFAQGSHLFRPWLCIYAARTVKTAVVIYGDIIYHGAINISVMNHCCIYINNRGVVTKPVTFPGPAYKADAPVAISIVNSSIKTYVRAPIAGVKAICSAFVAPIGRGPQQAEPGRRGPVARDPIITIFVIVGPVSGYPKVALYRAGRLFINRQGWGGKSD